MHLTIDIGNTSIAMAVMDGATIVKKMRISTHLDSGDYYFEVGKVVEVNNIDKNSILEINICSVVPEIKQEFIFAINKYFEIEPKYYGSAADINIKANIDQVSELGADRLIASYAAYKKFQENCIVVDFGTATTFDLISEDGIYQGGAIAPGAEVAIKALAEAASQLEMIEITVPEVVIGKNTDQALHSGFYWGYIGLVDYLAEKIMHDYGKECKVVGTGGLAKNFALNSSYISETDDDLIFKGLEEISRINN